MSKMRFPAYIRVFGQFMDAENFDVRSVKKTCVHIVHPDGRIIPFDTFNLFYRDGREKKLKELQTMHDLDGRAGDQQMVRIGGHGRDV